MTAYMRVRKYGSGFLCWTSLYFPCKAEMPDDENFKFEATANLRLFQNRTNPVKLMVDARNAVMETPGFGDCIDEWQGEWRNNKGEWIKFPVLVLNKLTKEWREIPYDIYEKAKGTVRKETAAENAA